MSYAVEGPIGTEHSTPYGSATRKGSEEARLLAEFDYAEAEFFVSGTANTYGPESLRPLAYGEDLYALKPLSTVCERDVPFKTRVLVVRPRDMRRFSGTVHAIPFHNLGATVQLDRHLTRPRRRLGRHRGVLRYTLRRRRDAERRCPQSPSDRPRAIREPRRSRRQARAVAGSDPGRPRACIRDARLRSRRWRLDDGVPSGALPQLPVGAPTSTSRWSWRSARVTVACCPPARCDACTPPAGIGRVRDPAPARGVPPRSPPRSPTADRSSTATSSASGQVPVNRPDGAVLVILQSEAEALTNVESGEPLPDDTDDPRFRYYEVAGTGHRISADPPRTATQARSRRSPPEGIRGLSQRDESGDLEPYDGSGTAPILWAIWDAMYRVGRRRHSDATCAAPRPRRAIPATHRDGIARDGARQHDFRRAPHPVGRRARRPLRRPHLTRQSIPLPGYAAVHRRRDAGLYGSHDEYERLVQAHLDDMVRDRFLLADDCEIFFG